MDMVKENLPDNLSLSRTNYPQSIRKIEFMQKGYYGVTPDLKLWESDRFEITVFFLGFS